MNGETLELESGDKVTIAHDGEGGRATITVQGSGSVAIAHLTPAEAMHAAATMGDMAVHLDPDGVQVGELGDVTAISKELEEAKHSLAETESLMAQGKVEHESALASMKMAHETALANLVGELEAAKAAAVHAPIVSVFEAPAVTTSTTA